MKYGYVRVASVTTEIKVADTEYNADRIIEGIIEGGNRKVQLMVFPELAITGYTCGDLFLQKALLDGALNALKRILVETSEVKALVFIGLPISVNGKTYNAAAAINAGRLLGIIPKTFVPNYGEFYELRHFSPANSEISEAEVFGGKVPFSTNLIFVDENNKDFSVACELCEDLWVANPPSSRHAVNGANVIVNLSASDEVVSKADYRRTLVQGQSARTLSAYVYTDAGEGESTTDLVFSGHNLIAENGALVAESKLFSTGLTIAEVDLEKLTYERKRLNTFIFENHSSYRSISFASYDEPSALNVYISQNPFIPEDTEKSMERAELILSIQANGIKKRLKHTGAKKAVIGVSGGLDSALALLATIRALRLLNRPTTDVLAISMPCFGTSKRTKSNAELISTALGAEFREINITQSVKAHFTAINQAEGNHDITFENAQARERTQVLMDVSNSENGLVIGTGDLSELALGWATYAGDHISNYGANASIPKTLVRHLVRYEADRLGGEAGRILLDILDTPVSPELLPPEKGDISQRTEDIVGPYELHDFFLYYALRWGFLPKKISYLACYAYRGVYDEETVNKWLSIFFKRFFSQQFKRSCLPDGMKVGSVTLSPRGDFRMPSDAIGKPWQF